MSETGRFNAILEIMGSDHHVHPHSAISEAMVALVEAIPSFIEKEVRKGIREELVRRGIVIEPERD